jgi:hypothetical protein
MRDLPEHEQPLSERYRLAGKAWREVQARATDYKENKDIVFSEMVMEVIKREGVPVNRAERIVKASRPWKEFIEKLVDASNEAGDLRIELKALEIEAEEIKQRNINAARERRMYA